MTTKHNGSCADGQLPYAFSLEPTDRCLKSFNSQHSMKLKCNAMAEIGGGETVTRDIFLNSDSCDASTSSKLEETKDTDKCIDLRNSQVNYGDDDNGLEIESVTLSCANAQIHPSPKPTSLFTYPPTPSNATMFFATASFSVSQRIYGVNGAWSSACSSVFSTVVAQTAVVPFSFVSPLTLTALPSSASLRQRLLQQSAATAFLVTYSVQFKVPVMSLANATATRLAIMASYKVITYNIALAANTSNSATNPNNNTFTQLIRARAQQGPIQAPPLVNAYTNFVSFQSPVLVSSTISAGLTPTMTPTTRSASGSKVVPLSLILGVTFGGVGLLCVVVTLVWLQQRFKRQEDSRTAYERWIATQTSGGLMSLENYFQFQQQQQQQVDLRRYAQGHDTNESGNHQPFYGVGSMGEQLPDEGSARYSENAGGIDAVYDALFEAGYKYDAGSSSIDSSSPKQQHPNWRAYGHSPMHDPNIYNPSHGGSPHSSPPPPSMPSHHGHRIMSMERTFGGDNIVYDSQNPGFGKVRRASAIMKRSSTAARTGEDGTWSEGLNSPPRRGSTEQERDLSFGAAYESSPIYADRAKGPAKDEDWSDSYEGPGDMQFNPLSSPSVRSPAGDESRLTAKRASAKFLQQIAEKRASQKARGPYT